MELIENKMKNKSEPVKIGDNRINNANLLLKLLFSSDENFFLKGVKYSILSYDTDTQLTLSKPAERLYKLQKASTNQQTVVDRSKLQDNFIERNLYVVKVTLILMKDLKNKSKLYCERKKLDIKKQSEIVKKSFATKSFESEEITAPDYKKQRQYLLPKGYLSLNDWRKVPYNPHEGVHNEYYVNYITGKTQIAPPPIPRQLLKDGIMDWDYSELRPPPPPGSRQTQIVQVPQQTTKNLYPPPPSALPVTETIDATAPKGGGGKTRKKHRKHKSTSRRKYKKRNAGRKNKTLKATPERIQKALKRNKLDSGNMSVYFASIKPANYFSERQISALNK